MTALLIGAIIALQIASQITPSNGAVYMIIRAEDRFSQYHIPDVDRVDDRARMIVSIAAGLMGSSPEYCKISESGAGLGAHDPSDVLTAICLDGALNSGLICPSSSDVGMGVDEALHKFANKVYEGAGMDRNAADEFYAVNVIPALSRAQSIYDDSKYTNSPRNVSKISR